MKEQFLTTVHRRNLLRFAVAGTVAAATAAVAPVAVATEQASGSDKRRPTIARTRLRCRISTASIVIPSGKGDVRVDHEIGT
jgi:hypothetical protein